MHFCGFSQHSFIHYFIFFLSTWGVISIPTSLLMGYLPLQTIINMWQHFHLILKACKVIWLTLVWLTLIMKQ